MERLIIEEQQVLIKLSSACEGRGYHRIFCGLDQGFVEMHVKCSRCDGCGWRAKMTGLTIEITETDEVALCNREDASCQS